MAALAINLFTLSILCLFCFSLTEAQKVGFSVELIHHDSPKSPFYNPLETHYQRVTKAVYRSINNLYRFDPTHVSPNAAQADLISNFGSYLINISIGTPPTPILGIADTGSDLIWTQCEPCHNCYKQKAKLFQPKSSSTYRTVACSSSQCKTLADIATCSSGTCTYETRYGDGSHTKGDIAVDTITLGSTNGRAVAFPKTLFGCGHDNAGTFGSEASGIVGFGGGDDSLITQMGFATNGKFSYCLVPFGSTTAKTSKLNFGSAAIVSGVGAVSTPLVSKNPKTFYHLTLKSISVANEEIPFGGSSSQSSEGNIIIDSGTTLTMLPQVYTSKLLKAISDRINAKPIKDPKGFLDLCYDATTNFKVPDVTIKFKGADVKLKPMHLFIALSEKVTCCIFKGSNSIPIYGNLQQVNFLVGYDTKKGTVSFKPTDCTKH